MYETAEKQLRLVTVVEEGNKNRHPPRIARNSSDHRHGAVIGEKGTRAHQDHFPGSRVLVLSSLMLSILIILCHTAVYIIFLLLIILMWLSDPHPSDF